MNLDAYFARTGYTGPRTPTLATLNGLVRAHVQTIPFENIDVLLGVPISLEPEAIMQKLVSRSRSVKPSSSLRSIGRWVHHDGFTHGLHRR